MSTHEFRLTYGPPGRARASARPLVRVLVFLGLPLLYYVYVLWSFVELDRRLVETDGLLFARAGEAERIEKLNKRMLTALAEDAPLIPDALLRPDASFAGTAETALPAGATWPVTPDRRLKYEEAARAARLARIARESGVLPTLDALRALPELAGAEATLLSFALYREPDRSRRAAFAIDAATYAPLKGLLDRIAADRRFADLTVRAVTRAEGRRKVEADARLTEVDGRD